MYIPLEWLFSIVTIVVAYGTYRLGRRDDEDYRQDIVDATIDHLIQENMAACLRGKRHAEREYSESVSYKCYKGKAETEIYMGEKSIKALILE